MAKISTVYTIRNSEGDVITTIDSGTRDTSTSLVLHGKGAPEYGLDRDQNLVYLLENFSNTTAPVNPIDGQLWWKTGDQLSVWDIQAGSPLGTGIWASLVPPPQSLGFIVEAGAGLTGGGFPTLSPLETTLNVGAGTGITVNPNDVEANPAEIQHDSLLNFVANEHINHSSVILTAGTGLTGGGSLTASRTFDIGAGDGIIINVDDVAVDSTVVRTGGSPIQTIAGIKTFTAQLLGDGVTTDATPGFSFDGDSDTGVRTSAGELIFVTGTTPRFTIETTGALIAQTAAYETLVTEDDDIPNKKYVDDAVGTGDNPTANTFVGVSSLSGLDGAQTYLVSGYGVIPDKGSGNATLSSIVVYRGSTTLEVGTVEASTGSSTIDWPDGSSPTFAQQIVAMNGDTSLNCVINNTATGGGLVGSTLLIAVQLTSV